MLLLLEVFRAEFQGPVQHYFRYAEWLSARYICKTSIRCKINNLTCVCNVPWPNNDCSCIQCVPKSNVSECSVWSEPTCTLFKLIKYFLKIYKGTSKNKMKLTCPFNYFETGSIKKDPKHEVKPIPCLAWKFTFQNI